MINISSPVLLTVCGNFSCSDSEDVIRQCPWERSDPEGAEEVCDQSEQLCGNQRLGARPAHVRIVAFSLQWGADDFVTPGLCFTKGLVT